MRELKFRYISAKNFMCFGPDGIELFFDDHGKVVLLNGLNLDTGTEQNPASNGSGKSSITDIIAYGLFGKTVKRPKKLDHGSVINALHKKKLEVVIEFNDFRVLRGRAPDKLRIWRSKDHLWDDDTEITPGGRGEPQKLIDREVGLSHTAFCNVVVFDDSNSYSFLELDAAGKRSVVENLLGLDNFKEYHENAKEKLKESKTTVRDLVKDYETVQNEIDAHDRHVAQIEKQQDLWRRNKEQEAKTLSTRLKTMQTELAACDQETANKLFESTQARIAELQAGVPEWEAKRNRFVASLKDANEKLNDGREGWNILRSNYGNEQNELTRLESELLKSKKLVNSLEKLEDGAECPVCLGEVSKDNYQNVLTHEHNTIQGLTDKINRKKFSLQEQEAALRKKQEFIQKLKDHITEAEGKLGLIDKKIRQEREELTQLLKIQRPDVSLKAKALETEIIELKKQLKEKQSEASGDSPYKEILESALQDKEEKVIDREKKSLALQDAEKELPYYEYWVEAFGDKGIRKYVIDGIIPSLNSRIAYWMQYLIDSKIELNFDNELNETIFVNSLETNYHAMSNGEKRRINLAVSQAFAYVMMLNSGSCPSLVFLDEITGGGIDRAGVTGIYNMVFELAKERQVFVTTHNETLLNMLQGCDSIALVKKDMISRLIA